LDAEIELASERSYGSDSLRLDDILAMGEQMTPDPSEAPVTPSGVGTTVMEAVSELRREMAELRRLVAAEMRLPPHERESRYWGEGDGTIDSDAEVYGEEDLDAEIEDMDQERLSFIQEEEDSMEL
jgi:hypothetical protein